MKFCCVPGCSNDSTKTDLSFFSLLRKRKAVLKQWIHAIGRKNLSINAHTRVCSEHFVNAKRRLLRPEEVPSLRIPSSRNSTSIHRRKPPKDRRCTTRADTGNRGGGLEADSTPVNVDVGLQTEIISSKERDLLDRIDELEAKLKEKDGQLEKQTFRLMNIKDDDAKVLFYTRFNSYRTFGAFFCFLGPAVNSLCYSSKNVTMVKKNRRHRSLPPIEECFLTLVRLRAGLTEQDIAYRFELSQSTVSRIVTTWINFMYLELKQIPLWPPRELIQANMPKQFKDMYPNTHVIIDATEIYIDQPRLPDIQQMTFSSYKNSNTFKGLIGISPDGAVTFVSSLYPGSISDKELTMQSGLLELLKKDDSVMADKGFEIEDELIINGVHLNLPSFLRDKKQFSEKELVFTRRIASLRIHVERAIERIKNFHIFDRSLPVNLTDIADRLFFVCSVLTNFQEPLCK